MLWCLLCGEAGGHYIPRIQGIAVGIDSFTFDAMALNPAVFGNDGASAGKNRSPSPAARLAAGEGG